MVSVICPTFNRPEMLNRCIRNFIAQDWHYEDREFIIIASDAFSKTISHKTVPSLYIYRFKEHYVKDNYKLIYAGPRTIGDKRNLACQKASGDIILHMDDDDLYAPDWITRSVEALVTSKADIVGLSNAYFHKGNDIYEYSNDKNSQLFLCGATLCYWRKTWERKPFPEVTKWPKNAGEDREFISNNGRLYCHGYKEGFLATIHGDNTCSHLAIPAMKKLPLNEAANIISRFYASPTV